MAKFPAPTDGIALTHFIVANDVERASRFYSDVLGGEVLREGEPTIIALANSWIIINIGGPPTDDKPTVTLEPPHDPDHISSFLNIRVADIHAVYEQWSARGARVPHPTHRPGSGAPLLHARPRRPPHRSWPNDQDPNAGRSELRPAQTSCTIRPLNMRRAPDTRGHDAPASTGGARARTRVSTARIASRIRARGRPVGRSRRIA